MSSAILDVEATEQENEGSVIGKRVTLLREGKGKTVVEIQGTVIHVDDTGLLTIEHQWGICYDRLGSKTCHDGQGNKKSHFRKKR
jgi:hypothetical protein